MKSQAERQKRTGAALSTFVGRVHPTNESVVDHMATVHQTKHRIWCQGKQNELAQRCISRCSSPIRTLHLSRSLLPVQREHISSIICSLASANTAKPTTRTAQGRQFCNSGRAPTIYRLGTTSEITGRNLYL